LDGIEMIKPSPFPQIINGLQHNVLFWRRKSAGRKGENEVLEMRNAICATILCASNRDDRNRPMKSSEQLNNT
jgi:hypothetical protein